MVLFSSFQQSQIDWATTHKDNTGLQKGQYSADSNILFIKKKHPTPINPLGFHLVVFIVLVVLGKSMIQLFLLATRILVVVPRFRVKHRIMID